MDRDSARRRAEHEIVRLCHAGLDSRALRVEALRRLGRVDEARRRAGELAARYPASSYAARALRTLPSP